MWQTLFSMALLALACAGVGGVVLNAWGDRLPRLPVLPIWVSAALAYFIGQGVLMAGFMALALVGFFYRWVILVILAAGAVAAGRLLWRSRREWADCLAQTAAGFRRAPPGWKGLALLTAGLYLYGLSSIGAPPAGDAVAFYLAVSKLTAYAHQLLPLPGYNDFTRSVGLYAEVLVAALLELRVPIDFARAYAWLNYLPTLVLFWALAWAVGLDRRGRLLTLCVALTSSAAVLLWGSGKSDLFAVGPALAAGVAALAAWVPGRRRGAALLTGLFCGLAVVLKLSLAAVLLPTVLILLTWPALFDLAASLRRRSLRRMLVIVRLGLVDLGLFALGLALMVLPHVVKNLWLGGSILDSSAAAASYYSAETTRRLVLTYPLALTYGRYWAQLGNLSPLVIAFLPLLLWLPRPASWRASRLTALTVATLTGLGCWVALMPSIFMPRYILSSLLMLGVPAAAAAAYFSRRSALAGAAVLLAAAVTMVFTPAHVNSWEPTFNWEATAVRLAHPKAACLTSAHVMKYCAAHRAINEAARDAPSGHDRVLLFSWYRLWLSPQFLLSTNTTDEALEIAAAPDPWGQVRRRGYGFVLLDSTYSPVKALTDQLAQAGNLREIFRDDTLSAYEIFP